MKRFLAAILAGIMVFSLVACDESGYSGDSGSQPSSSESVDDILDDVDDILGYIFGSEDNESSKTETLPYTLANIEFSIPSYYVMKDLENDMTNFVLYTDSEPAIILAFKEIPVFDSSVTQEEFDKARDEVFNLFEKAMAGIVLDFDELIDSHDILLATLPGRSFAHTTFLGSDDVPATRCTTFAFNIYNGNFIMMIMMIRNDIFPEPTEYIDDYERIIETAKLVSQNPTGDNSNSSAVPPSDDTKSDKSVSYSTNDLETAKKGNSGVFAYKNFGRKAYDLYWIIDFDEGYVYRFTEGNGNSICDRLKIDFGDLNNGLMITYHDGNDSWSYGLHFNWKNRPDTLILQEEDGYETKFATTDLDDALAIRDTKTIVDY